MSIKDFENVAYLNVYFLPGILDPPYEDGALDGLPYTTLSYANGPGPGRVNVTGLNTSATSYQQSRLVPLMSETHAGEDVQIFAKGPMAHLFHGVHEQVCIYSLVYFC